jgi:hypothetical protein
MSRTKLTDTREQVSDINTKNVSLANDKSKLENDIHPMQADLDSMLASCKIEKTKKAKVDAGRLADEHILSKTMQMLKKRQKGPLRFHYVRCRRKPNLNLNRTIRWSLFYA